VAEREHATDVNARLVWRLEHSEFLEGLRLDVRFVGIAAQ